MKKQNIAIIGIVAFVLVIAIGYAFFQETITITGTATAKGNLDVEITSVGTVNSKGYTKTQTTPEHELAEISDDKNTLTITVDKLDYPGAYVEIPVTLTNVGTIPAKLKNITESGMTSENGAIKVSYLGVKNPTTNADYTAKVLNQNDTEEITIRVEWLSDVNATESTTSFNVEFIYEQITNS